MGAITLWSITLLSTNFRELGLENAFFVLAGIISNVIVRISYYKGVDDVRIIVNELIFAAFPLYSLTLAFLLLEESIILENLIGTLYIIIGVISFERNLMWSNTATNKLSKKGILFSLFTD